MRIRSLLTLLVLGLCVCAAGALPACAASSVTLVSKVFQGPGAGADVVVAANVSPADGVTSIDLVYTYDPSLLLPTGVFKTGYTNGFALVSSIGVPGRVEIHLSGGAALAGSGDVAWVVFRTTGAPGQTATLTWVSALLNGGGVPSLTMNGAVTAQAAMARVSVPDTAQGMPGNQILVPISSTAISLADSFDLILTFNPAVVTAASLQLAPLTGCLTLASNTAVPGTVNMAIYSTTGCTVSGSGPLVNVTFDVVGPIGSRTPLNLVRAGINEGVITTVLDDGMFSVCSAADGDGDGFSGCAGDCDDANPGVHPGAAEVCNGRDDDCDGSVDNVAAPAGIASLSVAKQAGAARLDWPPVPGATLYDALRGDLGLLLASGGNFTASAGPCVGNDLTVRTVTDGSSLAAGQGFWYLVRPANCGGPGSYESGALSQVGLRNAEIQASPASCP